MEMSTVYIIIGIAVFAAIGVYFIFANKKKEKGFQDRLNDLVQRSEKIMRDKDITRDECPELQQIISDLDILLKEVKQYAPEEYSEVSYMVDGLVSKLQKTYAKYCS